MTGVALNLIRFETFIGAEGPWANLAGQLTRLNITRGGVSSVDVGVATATLILDADPLGQGYLMPGDLVRFRRDIGGIAPLFTGQVLDVDVNRVHDRQAQTDWLEITVTAVDAVAALGSRTRYGAVTDGGAGFESWANRIIRLAASSPTDVELPADDDPVVIYSI